MTRFQLSPATAQALELPGLLALVAHRAATDLGRERLLALTPEDDEERLLERRQAYEETERLLAERPLVPLLERPLGPLLRELERGGYDLGGRDLLLFVDLLRTSAEAAQRIRTADPACEALGGRLERLPPLDELRRQLEKTFDRRGEIREDATPRLAELRGKIRGVRNRLYTKLRSVVEEEREHLSEETVPLRDGRLVLMLQSGARGKMAGLVHGRSSSGRSFYFEPLQAVELNNDLRDSVEEEEAEKRRILAELVSRLCEELDAVRAHADLVAGLDVLQSSVRFAQAAGARLAEVGSRHQLKLKGARHPLLDPRLAELRQEALGQAGHSGEVVGLDLELDEERRAIVVTGPNAGGKTVALKTVGLLALAHQCGLPVPVDRGSRLPFLNAVVATVGDEQDLLADRSTFSGRLMRLGEAWEAASPDALVLLDELGSGTDPEEGTALSISLLEALLRRGSLTFVTTHLSQLAAAALDADGAICAAMEFNAETGRPTYQLLPGPPGGSEALALGRRLGLPSEWLDRADELLGSEHREFRRLLAEVERTRRELAATHEKVKTELDDAERLRRRLETREAELAAEKKSVGKSLKRELESFRDATRRRLREELEKIRAELAAGHKKGLVAAAERRLFEDAPQLVPAEDGDETAVAVGGRVRHRGFGWEGRLERLERGKAQVTVGGKIFRCREEQLMGLAEAVEAKKGGRGSRGSRGSVSAPESDAPRELKLIGRRVEPALEELDRFLDQALLASHEEVRIVHGHGSGQLRRAVREHLRGHAAVESYKKAGAKEGGDGATVVVLRQ